MFELKRICSASVYCRFLKRNIRLNYTQLLDRQEKVKNHKLFFSPDVELVGQLVASNYQRRFLQEFLIRNTKQFTGLNDCEARATNKLDFYWNCSENT